MNTGTQRLAIVLGGLGAIPGLLFLVVGGFEMLRNGPLPGWSDVATAVGIIGCGFLVPWGIVHAIAWVVRGFREPFQDY